MATDKPEPAAGASNTPSSSGRPCSRHIGSTANVGTPVSACSICGPGASKALIAAEFIENETAYQGAMRRREQLIGAEQMRERAAAVDVADEQSGSRGCLGHAHIDDVGRG